MALKNAPLKVLCAVVPRSKMDKANTLLSELGTCLNYTMLGQKINYSKLANAMGVTNFECAMIGCIVPSELAHSILVDFSNKINLLDIGGVAFLSPLSAISRNTLDGCFDAYDESQDCISERNAEIKAIMEGNEEDAK